MDSPLKYSRNPQAQVLMSPKQMFHPSPLRSSYILANRKITQSFNNFTFVSTDKI